MLNKKDTITIQNYLQNLHQSLRQNRLFRILLDLLNPQSPLCLANLLFDLVKMVKKVVAQIHQSRRTIEDVEPDFK
jgi:hypothetical protein